MLVVLGGDREEDMISIPRAQGVIQGEKINHKESDIKDLGKKREISASR